MKRIRLEQLAAVKAERPAGYVEDLVEAGSIAGDKLLVADEDWRRIREQYGFAEAEIYRATGQNPCQGCG